MAEISVAKISPEIGTDSNNGTRDFSWLEPLGVTLGRKRREQLKAMNDTEWEVNKLKTLLISCVKQNDIEGAMELYSDGKRRQCRPPQEVFHHLLNLFAGLGNISRENHDSRPEDQDGVTSEKSVQEEEVVAEVNETKKCRLDYVLELYEDMRSFGSSFRESSYTALVRCCAEHNEPTRAITFYSELKQEKVVPKSRTLTPLLALLTRSGPQFTNMSYSVLMEDLRVTYELEPLERDYVCVLEALERDGDQRFFAALSAYAEDIFVPCTEGLAVIQRWFQIAKVPGQISLGSNGGKGSNDMHFRVHRCTVDESGLVQPTGKHLQSLQMDPACADILLKQVDKNVRMRKEISGLWSSFTQWAEALVQQAGSSGPNAGGQHCQYDTVVDGANVGYFAPQGSGPRRGINYVQVDALMAHLRLKGFRPLLFLHSRHVSAESQYARPGTRERAIVEKWQQYRAPEHIPSSGSVKQQHQAHEGCLYTTPAGANDDWYWIYFAVRARCKLVVSNDLMRDHHFLLLSPRWFQRWKDRTQVKFAFGQRQRPAALAASSSETGEPDAKKAKPDAHMQPYRREVRLQLPSKYARRMQKIERIGSNVSSASALQKEDPFAYDYYFPVLTHDAEQEGDPWLVACLPPEKGQELSHGAS
jgi:pentatricopeptide repeat protein